MVYRTGVKPKLAKVIRVCDSVAHPIAGLNGCFERQGADSTHRAEQAW